MSRPALLLLLIAFLAACTFVRARATDFETATAMGVQPAAALLGEGQLLLEYPLGANRLALRAEWADDDYRRDGHNYRVATLEESSDFPTPGQPPRSRMRAVQLMHGEQWHDVMRATLESLLSPDGNAAIVFFVQGQAMLASRDPEGRPVIKPLGSAVQAPPGAPRVDEDRFAAEAEQAISRLYPQLVNQPLLFPTGNGNDAYVLFDPEHQLSVFIIRPEGLSGEHIGETLEYGLKLADALLLRGHVLAPLTSPFSTAWSLLSSTWHTVMTTLPSLGGNDNSTHPPVADQAGMDLVAFEKRLDEVVSARRSRGQVRLLVDGPAFFDSFSEAVKHARKSIRLRLYIFGTDDYALRIADLLKARSREIEVKVLLDYLGSLAAGRDQHGSVPLAQPPIAIFDYLAADSAVKVRTNANPWLTADHTKIMLIDSHTAFLGGMNIDRQYRYAWHDMMAEVKGPVVDILARDFEDKWTASGLGGDFARLFSGFGWKPRTAATGADVPLRTLYTKPGDAQILRAQLEAIARARRFIYVENPYLTDDEVVAALIAARGRGVDVRVILPSRTDSYLMTSANLVAAATLVRNGVRVYAYPGMTHLKATLIDGWSCFGSANLDKLSLRMNLEANLASSDPGIAAALNEQVFTPDFARSRELENPPEVGFGNYLVNFFAEHL